MIFSIRSACLHQEAVKKSLEEFQPSWAREAEAARRYSTNFWLVSFLDSFCVASLLIKIFLECVFIISRRARAGEKEGEGNFHIWRAKSTNWCIFKSFEFMFTICFLCFRNTRRKKRISRERNVGEQSFFLAPSIVCNTHITFHAMPKKNIFFSRVAAAAEKKASQVESTAERHKTKWTWRKRAADEWGGEKIIINYSYHTIQ